MKSRGTTSCTLFECSSVVGSSDTNDGVNRVYVCVTMVSLLMAGYSLAKVHVLLSPPKVYECHVYHVKKLFEETGDVCECP